MKYRYLLLCAACLATRLGAQGTAEDYRRAFDAPQRFSADQVYHSNVEAHWVGTTHHFWYRNHTPQGDEYVVVDADARTRSQLFDTRRCGGTPTAAPSPSNITNGDTRCTACSSSRPRRAGCARSWRRPTTAMSTIRVSSATIVPQRRISVAGQFAFIPQPGRTQYVLNLSANDKKTKKSPRRKKYFFIILRQHPASRTDGSEADRVLTNNPLPHHCVMRRR